MRFIAIRPIRLFIPLLFLLVPVFLFAQQGKTDRVFSSLILQKNIPDSARIIPSPFKEIVHRSLSTAGAMETLYEAIIYTKNGRSLLDRGINVQSILPGFVTARISISDAERLATMNDVDFITAPAINYHHNDLAVAATGATLLHNGRLNNTSYKGKNVIVAIIDSGIDWDHPDFRDPADQTKSRILRIWDQTITPIAGETSPSGFGFGVEYTKAHIENEIDGTPANFVREQDVNGHGTHVTGTAAGNGAGGSSSKYAGMAPEADIVVIKGGNGSFSDNNIIDALSYLQTLSGSLGKPIVVNMSLGGQFGPHDGTTPLEVAVDNFTSSSGGRIAVISAGNDNGTNIHNQLTLAASGSNSVTFIVPAGSGGVDVLAYRIYLDNNSDISATLTAPEGATVSANVGQSSNALVVGGAFRGYVDNFVDAGNGDRYVEIYISRIVPTTSPGGTWTLALTNNTGNILTADGWLYYKSSSFSGTTITGGNSNYLVGTPGNATSAITVASYVSRLAWSSTGGNVSYNSPAQGDNISTFSAIGPRRDNVQKPDIAAHGQAVISSYSSNTTPAASTTQVVVPGLYRINQGTSMSSPVVAGGVALLLQANPTASASQIKTFLTSTANTDALTGAVPNTTWGYGKADVFKAASEMFNCSPGLRKMYQYDNSATQVNEASLGLTSERVAVRFTTDMGGNLAGFFLHSHTTFTDLVAEVRNTSGVNPGTLIQTLNIPASSIDINSWNYIDLSSYNLTLATATDYHIVIYRSTAAGWSVKVDNVSPDSRTTTSGDGITWTPQAFDVRIRPVVYNNSQLAGTIASINSTDTRTVNSSNQFINGSCQLINQVVPFGGNPVTGSVESMVWIESSVPVHNTIPFVARHYQITPAENPATSTALVTLYFTQQEFTDFNNHPGSVLNLPANSVDIANKTNLRVGKLSGSSNNGSGLPSSYNSGSSSTIDPVDTDIVWNVAASRWEVTIYVDGFSGFVIQSASTNILPVHLEYFTGQKHNTVNNLKWKVNCYSSSANFEIERSVDGVNFNSIGSIGATESRCQDPFNFSDALPATGKNFYRVRITDASGLVKYSGIILLVSGEDVITAVYPSSLRPGEFLQVSYQGLPGAEFILSDGTGRKLFSRQLVKGVQSFETGIRSGGVYFYRIVNPGGTPGASGKLIIQ